MRIAPAAALLFSIAVLSHISFAAPFLHSPQPSNNTYTTGGTIGISINITDANLAANSAVVKIIEQSAYLQNENWVAQSLSCAGGPIEWKCTSSFITSTIGTDTAELFYFEANDTSGSTGNNGTAAFPYKFTIDRQPPIITFVNPTANTYTGGSRTMTINVADYSSGANNNTVQFSTDGSVWTTMSNSTGSFQDNLNALVFSNNQTITLYARASDNVGNNVTSGINITIDNEVPQIVAASLPGVLSGSVQLQVNATDSYSGINLNNVRYTVESLNGNLGCTGGNYTPTCSAVLSTASLDDGDHTINFTITDQAGNANWTSVQIKTNNIQPTISLTSPANNALIRQSFSVKAALANANGVASHVEVILQGAIATTRNMTCTSNMTSCEYSLDSSTFLDGLYTVKVNAVNNQGMTLSSSASVTFDNTYPAVTILKPDDDVKGSVEVQLSVVDSNLDTGKILLTIASYNDKFACTPQTPSRYTCSTTFNSKQLGDGKYILKVSAQDKAGNIDSVEKAISVANAESSTAGSTPSSSTTPAPSSETTAGTETSGSPKGRFIGISIPFDDRYIMMGIVATTVLVIVIILALVVKQKIGKTIITPE